MTDTPPQNLDAEESVLGALLQSPAALEACAELLTGEDFYRPSNGRTFTAALELSAKGTPVDVLTLTHHLGEKVSEVGGEMRLRELALLQPSTANAAHYARIVKDTSVARALVDTGREIMRLGYEQPDVDRAQQLVYAIDTPIGGEPRHISLGVQSALERAADAQDSPDGIIGTPTGLEDLDRLTLGFERRNLIVLAGRPSMGKSALAFQIAGHVTVRKNQPVALFTLEMSETEVAQRMLSAASRVNLQKIRGGNLTTNDWASLRDAGGRVSGAPFFVDDNSALTPVALRAKIRRLQQRHGELGLVIVDYLGLMADGDAQYRTQEVGRVCRALKLTADELNVPLLALSQLNRLSETERRRPRLSDLRDSGEIEQHAHVVIFVHRASKTDAEGVLIVDKNRNGPTGDVPVIWRSDVASFVGAARLEAVA